MEERSLSLVERSFPEAFSVTGIKDIYGYLGTPIGILLVAYSQNGIIAVRTIESSETFESWFLERFGSEVLWVSELPNILHVALLRHFRGEEEEGLTFDLRSNNELEQKILLKTLNVPRGEQVDTSWLLDGLSKNYSEKDIEKVLETNPVLYFIPTHRIRREIEGDEEQQRLNQTLMAFEENKF
jgi:O6-methylguanine-DNA--protein-cysteine methyltransferase